MGAPGLGSLLGAEVPVVSWSAEWAASTAARFTEASAGLGEPTGLDSASIEEVLICPGWWAGQREVDESELSMAGVRTQSNPPGGVSEPEQRSKVPFDLTELSTA